MTPGDQKTDTEPMAGTSPTVTGRDRIDDREARLYDELAGKVSARPVAEPAPYYAPPLELAPPVPPAEVVHADPVASEVPVPAAAMPEIAGHRVDIADAAPIVRPVTLDGGLSSEPHSTAPDVMITPVLAAAAIAPALIAPTTAAPPPLPPRPSPPPLPAAAMPAPPSPPARVDITRKPLVGAAPRQTLSPEHYPMPSTIAPTDQQRKRTSFRSRAARSSVVVVFDGMLTLATIIAVVLWVFVDAGRLEFELPGPLAATKTVIIPAKKSRDEIGDILETAGVVSNGTVFVYGAAIAQLSDLKAGEYEFKPRATMRDVAEALQHNKVVQHKVTFPEGWTSEQIVQRLIDDQILTGKIVAIPEEGSLLPDTYTFPRGETRQQILDQMRRNQDRRLTEIWAHRNADALKQLKVPKDLVILASIVEKETSKPDERARIAGVFVNRLNRNMRLETDPTILYGLYGGKAWTEPRTISKADLAASNPYNTYKINGLPPGPIGNPGRAALEAAANPIASNELFFVADGTGGHAFADTFDEHKKNVDKWREIERQRRAGDTSTTSTPTLGQGTGIQTTPAVAPVVTAPVRPTVAPARPAAPVRPRAKAVPGPDPVPADTN